MPNAIYYILYTLSIWSISIQVRLQIGQAILTFLWFEYCQKFVYIELSGVQLSPIYVIFIGMGQWTIYYINCFPLYRFAYNVIPIIYEMGIFSFFKSWATSHGL